MAKDSRCQPLNHITRSSRVSRPGEQARLCLAVTQELYQLKNCTWAKLWVQYLVVPNPVPGTCMCLAQVYHLINEAKVIGEWKERKLYFHPCDCCKWGYRQTASVCQSYRGAHMKTSSCGLTFSGTLHHDTSHTVNMWCTTLLPPLNVKEVTFVKNAMKWITPQIFIKQNERVMCCLENISCYQIHEKKSYSSALWSDSS